MAISNNNFEAMHNLSYYYHFTEQIYELMYLIIDNNNSDTQY